MEVLAFKPGSPLQRLQLDEERDADNASTELPDHRYGSVRRAARREQVIDDQDSLSG